jgi:hypothetical protein
MLSIFRPFSIPVQDKRFLSFPTLGNWIRSLQPLLKKIDGLLPKEKAEKV